MILKDTHYIDEFSSYYIPGVEKVIIRSVVIPTLTEDDLFSFEYDYETYNFDIHFNLSGLVFKVIKYKSADKSISRTYIFEYDSSGRPTSFTELYGDEAKHNLTSTITYDDKGRVVARKQLSRGFLGNNDEEVNISYTYEEKKETITVSQNGIVEETIMKSYVYAKNGKINKIMYYDASELYQGFEEFIFDPTVGLIRSHISKEADNTVNYKESYSYNQINDLKTYIYRSSNYNLNWRYEYNYLNKKIWSDKFCYLENRLMLITNRTLN